VRRPRLLFLISEDWVFCSHRLPLAVAAREAGFEVTIATRVNQDGGRIRAAGLDLVPLHWSRRSTHPLRELAALRELVAVFRRVRPDIVHQVAVKPVLYGAVAARLTGVPLVVNALTGMGYIFSSHDLKARLLRPLVRAALHLLLDRRNARLILQNADDVGQFTREGIVDPARVALIRGAGVDLREFTAVPEPPGPPLVVLPARMLRDKGVEEFVAAARALKAAGVVARFALVGAPDPENPACIPEARLAQWAAEGVVEIWGHRRDMATVFQQCHVVCLPSYREGLPKALIEAAACRRPIVTADVPGCREVVRDGDNGLLVQVRDSVTLADVLRRLLASPALRAAMGRRGRERAEQEFSLEGVIAQTIAVYDEATAALGGRVPPRLPGSPETGATGGAR
jgi:glycosyltransferase involved in cell wall biosynthesis